MTARGVESLAGGGRQGAFADGGGLYLQLGRGRASWVFRYRANGRLRGMGLGPLHTVPLALARQKAMKARRQRLDGEDPIETRRTSRRAARLEAAKAMTFRQCAEACIAAQRPGWRNAKHAAQWPATLAAYAYPVFGEQPVQAIDTALVIKAIEPIWTGKPETASRLRGRIEAVLDWAKARSFRDGENPARWRGHLDKLLAPRAKVRRVVHHAALPYREIADFMTALRQQAAAGARALEFAILTAARTGEVIGARWSEIDLEAAVWTIPAERMKGGQEHRVPLSSPALALLRALQTTRQGEFVFAGGRRGRPLSNMALLMTLRRMRYGELTTHGFRSTFRDWAAEQTNFPREIAEMSLAHTVNNKVEAAYRRGDLFEKRRRLMGAWANACSERTESRRQGSRRANG